MQIHVMYVMWVGIILTNPLQTRRQLGERFFSECKIKKIEMATIKYPYSNSCNIGYGVIIDKTKWDAEKLNSANIFDSRVVDKAERILMRLNKVFRDLNIELTANIYHHAEVRLF